MAVQMTVNLTSGALNSQAPASEPAGIDWESGAKVPFM
jgi:hypothetical protein